MEITVKPTQLSYELSNNNWKAQYGDWGEGAIGIFTEQLGYMMKYYDK